jgi:hypothetical protein
MENSKFLGQWVLVGSISVNSEISFIAEEPDPNGVADWLNGFDASLRDLIKPTTGLRLEIRPDARFTEVMNDKPEMHWFDAEGVLDDVAAFDGSFVETEQGLYLRPDEISEWAMPTEGQYGQAVLRLDDGDTKISDNLRLSDDYLLRTVNVVTDELYLDRILIVYKRQE